MADTFTVEMGIKRYSIVAPDGEPGEPVRYGIIAMLHWKDHYYYSHVDDPDLHPEGGAAPAVLRVDQTTTMESTMLEVEDGDEEEDEEDEDEGEDEGEEEEQEEEEPEEGEPREAGVIEFPDGEDPDEDLPRAEDTRN